MWITTPAGIGLMLAAADSAVLGSRREDYLDAGNAWIGAAIRFRVIQTVSGADITVHERTHATGMTRTGEELIAPNTSWTVVSHQAFDPAAGPLRVRIEKASDATAFFEHAINPSDGGSISAAMGAADTLSLNIRITANNIADAGEIATPPAEFLYRIYDDPAAPIPVPASLVGMHFTNAANIASPGYDYDTFRTFDCPALRWSAIETADNTFSWTSADAAINAAHGAGKRIVFVVNNPPAFHVSTGPYPDGNWPALTRFVEAVMTRYAGKLWAVQWWSRPDLASQLAEFAQGQVRTYQAVKAADPNVLVILSGARTAGASIEVDQGVINAGLQTYASIEARNAADILGFQSFGPSPVISSALACFRSLVATRDALRPGLAIAVDMCGADETSGAGFTEPEHIRVIEQLLLLGTGFGAAVVGLYAHERSQEIGNPSGSATVRAAIDAIHDGIAGKQVARAYVLTDDTVWIALTDGTTLQSPGGTYVPPVDPDPDRDLRVHPFAINDVTNLAIGSTSVYATTSDLATNLVRAGVGLNGGQNSNPNSQWSIPRYIGIASDPILNIRVYAPGTNPANGTVISVRCPTGALPSRPWKPSDGHFCVINGNTIHEFWECEPPTSAHPNEWYASSYTPAPLDGASWGYHLGFGADYTIPGMLGWGSTRAFGGSQNLGLIMPVELEAGLIPHAIGFAQRMQDLSTTNAPGLPHRWVWPATRDDGGGSYTQGINGVRQGQCFAIPKSVNLVAEAASRGWPAYVLTIAKALQDYGAICIDQSGDTCIYLELTTRTSTTLSKTDTNDFRDGLAQAWGMLRRVTNHTQSTPKGNTSSPPPDPDPDPSPGSYIDHPFSASSPWNTPIPAGAIWRGPSDARTARIRSNTGGPSYEDQGPIEWGLNVNSYTITTFYAQPGGPMGTITDNRGITYPIPIPPGAFPSPGTDAHMCIVDSDGLHSHDYIGVTGVHSNRIDAWGYVKTRLDGSGFRLKEEALITGGNPYGRNPANASAGGDGPRAVSVGLLGGLIRKRHLDDGVIPHALGYAIPRRWARGGINVRIWPADFIIGWGDSDNGLPPYFSGDIRYCDRFALDPSVNVESLPLSREWKIVARALQVYGMYLVDVAGPLNPCLYMESPDGVAYGNDMRNTQAAAFAVIVPLLMAVDWY